MTDINQTLHEFVRFLEADFGKPYSVADGWRWSIAKVEQESRNARSRLLKPDSPHHSRAPLLVQISGGIGGSVDVWIFDPASGRDGVRSHSCVIGRSQMRQAIVSINNRLI